MTTSRRWSSRSASPSNASWRSRRGRFRAATAHLSVFPFSPAVVQGVADRLAGFHLSKGTVRFTSDNPLPDDVVEDMVRLRVAEITGAAGT